MTPRSLIIPSQRPLLRALLYSIGAPEVPHLLLGRVRDGVVVVVVALFSDVDTNRDPA